MARSRAAARTESASRSARSAAVWAAPAAAGSAAWKRGGGRGAGLGEPVRDGGGLGLPGVHALLVVAALTLAQERGGGLGRGGEARAVGGVREPVVGLLETLGGEFGVPYGAGGVDQEGDPPLQAAGVLGHGGERAAAPGEFLVEGELLAVQGLAPRGPRGDPPLGLPLRGDPLLVLALGPCEPLPCAVGLSGERVRLGVQTCQLVDFMGEFVDGGLGRPGRGARLHLRAGRGPGLVGDGERTLGGRTGLLGAGVDGVGGVLGGAVDVVGGGAGRGRVGGGAADLAGVARGEGDREFGGDALQAAGLDVEPALVGGVPALPGVREAGLGRPGVLGEGVTAAGRVA